MLRSLRTSLASAALLAVCASAQAQSLHSVRTSVETMPAADGPALASLARGTRTVLLPNLPTAENLLFLSDGRLLVTGDKGIYLVSRDAAGTITADNVAPSAPCAFGGLVEVRGTIYANCYDFKSASIYASALAPLAFSQVREVKDAVIGNGLSSDGAALYTSATLQSKILRLAIDPSDPRKLGEATTLYPGALDTPLPNGVKVHAGKLYWTDMFTVKTGPLDGSGKPATFANRVTLFDDLYVDAQGVIACDYTGNVLVAYDATGKQVAQTPAVFQSPSAVLPARGRLGFGPNDLIVTERGGGVVSVYRPE